MKTIGLSFISFILSIAVSVGIFLLFMYLMIKPDIENKSGEVNKRVDNVVNDVNTQLKLTKQTTDSQASVINTIGNKLPDLASKAEVTGVVGRVDTIDTKVKAIDTKLPDLASKAEVTGVVGRVDTIDTKVKAIDTLATTQRFLIERQNADETTIQSLELTQGIHDAQLRYLMSTINGGNSMPINFNAKSWEPAKDKRRRKRTEPVRFDNQTTLVLKVFDDIPYFVNAKCFKNGNVQITGIKNDVDGQLCIQIIADTVKAASAALEEDKVVAQNYKIHLINTDFKVPFKIDNYALQHVMISKYNNVSIYEKSIYPGVKIVYFYNKENMKKDGNCCCDTFCQGKACKKVTIAVFQSGSVIITGGVAKHQIDEAHVFITTLLLEHKHEVEMQRTLIVDEFIAAAKAKAAPKDIMQFFKGKVEPPVA
eukprot:gene19593-26275_t